MTAIGPGDWVECVGGWHDDSKSYAPVSGAKPQRGRIYLVDFVGGAEDRNGRIFPALTLVSPKAYSERGREIGWRADYFRPIYRPKSDLIERLKVPADLVGA